MPLVGFVTRGQEALEAVDPVAPSPEFTNLTSIAPALPPKVIAVFVNVGEASVLVLYCVLNVGEIADGLAPFLA